MSKSNKKVKQMMCDVLLSVTPQADADGGIICYFGN